MKSDKLFISFVNHHFIKIFISLDMIDVTVRINHFKRQICHCTDFAYDVAETITGIDEQCIFFTSHKRTENAARFIQLIDIVTDSDRTPFTHVFAPCLDAVISTWHIFIVASAARWLFFVTPAQQDESTCTVISGQFALISNAFETTQISVQRPTSSTSPYFSDAMKPASAVLPNEGLSNIFTASASYWESSPAIFQPSVFSMQCSTGRCRPSFVER